MVFRLKLRDLEDHLTLFDAINHSVGLAPSTLAHIDIPCSQAYHPTSVMNTIAKVLLFGASMALVLSKASSQSTNTSDDGVSCVSIVDALLDKSPCYQVAYSFTMNGNTSIEANTVSHICNQWGAFSFF